MHAKAASSCSTSGQLRMHDENLKDLPKIELPDPHADGVYDKKELPNEKELRGEPSFQLFWGSVEFRAI